MIDAISKDASLGEPDRQTLSTKLKGFAGG
jgi:hypothetical protein